MCITCQQCSRPPSAVDNPAAPDCKPRRIHLSNPRELSKRMGQPLLAGECRAAVTPSRRVDGNKDFPYDKDIPYCTAR